MATARVQAADSALIMVCRDNEQLCFGLQATYSALIIVCINNEQLERAGEVYQLTVKAGLHPDIHAYNALINAYGCNFQVCCGVLCRIVL